jgi:hypothetical protein
VLDREYNRGSPLLSNEKFDALIKVIATRFTNNVSEGCTLLSVEELTEVFLLHYLQLKKLFATVEVVL